MRQTVAIVFEEGHAAVFLYEGSTLVGGWMNQDHVKAADIAAEVLKVTIPDATVIPMLRHEKEAMAWWDGIQTFRTTNQSLAAPPPAGFPSPSSDF